MHIAHNNYHKIAKKDEDNSIARIDTKGEQTIPDEQTCIKIYKKKRILLESNKRTHKKEARITLLPLHFGLSSDFLPIQKKLSSLTISREKWCFRGCVTIEWRV